MSGPNIVAVTLAFTAFSAELVEAQIQDVLLDARMSRSRALGVIPLSAERLNLHVVIDRHQSNFARLRYECKFGNGSSMSGQLARQTFQERADGKLEAKHSSADLPGLGREPVSCSVTEPAK